jgi:hypothetical protein
VPDNADLWKLEDPDPVFERWQPYRKRQDVPTQHVSFRCPEPLLRQIDERLASKLAFGHKTRSDIFVDAAAKWLKEAAEVSGDDHALGEYELEAQRQQQEQDIGFLDAAESNIRMFQAAREPAKIQKVLDVLLKAKVKWLACRERESDLMIKLDDCIHDCRRILS